MRFAITVVILSFVHSAVGEWYEHSGQAMGTEVSVQLWAESSSQAKAAIDSVMLEMRRVDANFSPYKTESQLSKLNRSAASGPVKVTEELAHLIGTSLEVSKLTGGAFDISFSSIGQFYNFREKKKPSLKQLGERKSAINYRHILLDRNAPSVSYQHKLLAIDLGGIAKGYAVDRSIEKLRTNGVKHARVSAGGDSRMLGDKRGRPWITGIRDPRAEGSSLMLPIENSAISTSGDYERFFIDHKTGERHHHIISPSTGRSATQVQSVTILAEDAISSDALSTSVFVLGVEKGLKLVNGLPGVDAVIIDAQGLLHYSDDLQRTSISNDF